ncbi:hypothetical protein, partial [Planifilum fimeticola]|uniref:hypothetical protein n=1 Tax=Planifilum fimeticola TaxID=201975 RepID=UPI001B808FCD
KHQKNGLAPLEERKRLCDPPNLPNLISFICLFPINMQPLALFLRKEPGGLSSISPSLVGRAFLSPDSGRMKNRSPAAPFQQAFFGCAQLQKSGPSARVTREKLKGPNASGERRMAPPAKTTPKLRQQHGEPAGARRAVRDITVSA